jgi:hypothetical protein
MGPNTDELKAVKAELDEAEHELDEARQTVWIQRAKAAAIVLGALATLATAILAHFRPEEVAEQTAGAAAKQLRQIQAAMQAQDKAVEAAQEACQRAAAEGAAKARAEADSVRTMLLGYLLARQGRVSGEVKTELAKVVKQLGKHKMATGLKPLIRRAARPANMDMVKQKIRLIPPKRLEQLSKGAK